MHTEIARNLLSWCSNKMSAECKFVYEHAVTTETQQKCVESVTNSWLKLLAYC